MKVVGIFGTVTLPGFSVFAFHVGRAASMACGKSLSGSSQSTVSCMGAANYDACISSFSARKPKHSRGGCGQIGLQDWMILFSSRVSHSCIISLAISGVPADQEEHTAVMPIISRESPWQPEAASREGVLLCLPRCAPLAKVLQFHLLYSLLMSVPLHCSRNERKRSTNKDHEQGLVPVGVRKQPHMASPTKLDRQLQEHRLQAVAVATADLRYPLPRPSRTRLRLHACVRRMCIQGKCT